MMLQIGHRESRDVDIFLPDPQLLAMLDPEKHDFAFDVQPTDYQGDGAKFLKITFENIGEIDFIVASALTSKPTTPMTIEGENVLLETIPEIIAKKICHRGASIKARDIFDIAAAGVAHADLIISELRPYKDEVIKVIATMEKLNPEFVSRAILELAIRPRYEAIAKTASERAKELLLAV